MTCKLTIVVDEAKLREATKDGVSPIDFLIKKEMECVEDSGIHLTDLEKNPDWEEYADNFAENASF